MSFFLQNLIFVGKFVLSIILFLSCLELLGCSFLDVLRIVGDIVVLM